MKKVIIVFSEEYGEVEGAFTEDGKLIGFWSANDASWRDEYFSPFLRAVGIETSHVGEGHPFYKKLLKEARKYA